MTDLRLGDLPHEERVRVIRDEIERVTRRLRELDSRLLDEPAIGDWSVREVVAHLGVVAEFYAGSIARGASGDSTVSGNRPAAGTGRGAIAAAGILERAVEVAGAQDNAVIDEFHSAATALADTLDANEADLDFGCYHPGGIIPANRFAILFLKELGLHEWDIFEAVDPPGAMSRWGVDAALQAMEEELASGSLRWVTGPARNPATTTLRVTTSGEVEVERDLVLEPEQTRLVAVQDQRPADGRLSLDAADFVLGCSGRRDLVAVIEQGRGSGDLETVRIFAQRLTGM